MGTSSLLARKSVIGLAAFVIAALAGTAQAQVRISQVYGLGTATGNGTAAPANTVLNGDFVELFNAGPGTVDISGWSVQVATGVGTAWYVAAIPAGTSIPSQKYYTIRLERAAAGSGIEYASDLDLTTTPGYVNYPNYLLSGSGKIALLNVSTPIGVITCPVTAGTAGLQDFFSYGTAAAANCFEGAQKLRAAATFGTNIAYTRNSQGCADTNNNNADFTELTCNPRTLASPGADAQLTLNTATAPNIANSGVTIGNSITFTTTINLGGCIGGGANGTTTTIDLSNLGGSATQAMNVAGNVASYTHTVNAGAGNAGGKLVTISSTGAGGLAGTQTITVPFYTDLPTTDLDFGVASGSAWTNTSGAQAYTAGQVKWFKVSVPEVTNVGANQTYFDADLEGSTFDDGGIASDDGYLVMYSATGKKLAEDDDDGSGLLPQLSFGGGTRPQVGTGTPYNGRDGVLAAGIYYIAAFHWDAAQTIDEGFRVDSTTGAFGTIICNVRFGLVNPPAPPASFQDFGTITADGEFATRSVNITAAGQIAWFKFTTASPVDFATRTFIDLDTETTTGIVDTVMAVYKAADGQFFGLEGIAAGLTDDDGGTGTGTADLSRITIGRGIRPAAGANGANYGGQTAATLAAGSYYVAVGEFASTFADQWTATSGGATAAGTVVLRIRQGTSPLPAAPTPISFDFGTMSGAGTQPAVSTAIAYDATTDTKVVWFKFVTPEATNATDKYVDIDTIGTNLSANNFGIDDTHMGLYKENGDAVVFADDSNPNPAPTPASNLSAVSFGQTTPQRVRSGGLDANGNTQVVANGAGQSGAVLAAGTYYVGVAGYQLLATAAQGWDFAITSNATTTGTIALRIGSNLVAAPARCNAADVAGLGGSVGPDLQLTADDVVVYLGAFFAGTLSVADIAVLGGAPGADGQLTADDIVYFLGQFFSPCN